MAEHPKRSPVVQSLLHYGQGLMMGAADIVPGISGGTVALIVGIYERLILSIRALASVPVDVVRGSVRSARGRIGEVYWWLVIPLGLGIVTALLVGARFIPEILERFPVESRALFFGLIAGSLIIPWARIDRVRNIHYLAALVAAVVAFLIVGFPPREVMAPALPIVFLAASIAICAMILPGVSGSFLLLVMGMYEVTLNALNARDIPYVAVFILRRGGRAGGLLQAPRIPPRSPPRPDDGGTRGVDARGAPRPLAVGGRGSRPPATAGFGHGDDPARARDGRLSLRLRRDPHGPPNHGGGRGGADALTI